MPEYRYTLEKGSRKHICPECGKKTFVRYVDEITSEHLPERYGRCDREQNCAYHLNPYVDGYGKNESDQYKAPVIRKTRPATRRVHFDVETYKMAQAPARYAKNVFLQNLIHRVPFPFSPTQVNEVAQLYQLGTVTQGYMAGAVTFPFIDKAGNIRAVQVKQFDETNHTTRTSFLHSIIERYHTQHGQKLPGWLKAYTKQDKRISCLFGAHLLRQYPNNPIALVEAPKTAIYGTLYFGLPQSDNDLIWLAVYNKGSFTFDKISALHGRTVFVFPDLSKDGSTFKEWQRKAKDLESRLPGTRFVFSDLLEQFAVEQDREEGQDLADYLIKLDWRIFRQPAPSPAPAPATPAPAPATPATTATEPHKPQPDKKHQTTPTPAPAPTAAPTAPPTAAPTAAVTTTVTPGPEEGPHPTTTATPAPAPTAGRPATTAVTPEKAKSQDATQPDQKDMIIQARTDYSEAQIIQAIERISPAANARQALRTWIDEGKLHRCKATKAIYYVPF